MQFHIRSRIGFTVLRVAFIATRPISTQTAGGYSNRAVCLA
jgi:hypothetical protein